MEYFWNKAYFLYQVKRILLSNHNLYTNYGFKQDLVYGS